MTVESDLDTIWSDGEQTRDTLSGRSELENCYNNLVDCDTAIQALVDDGSFSSIPVDLKSTLTDWWIVVKSARAAIESDANIMAVLGWRPTP